MVEAPSRVVQLGAGSCKDLLTYRLTRLTGAEKTLIPMGKQRIGKHQRYERTRRTELSTGNN